MTPARRWPIVPTARSSGSDARAVQRARRNLASVATVCILLACGHGHESSSGAIGAGPLAQGQALLDQGQVDAALKEFEKVPTADGFYSQGLAWIKKAESAPLPLPGAVGEAGTDLSGYKPEELQAISFLEKALALQEHHAKASLALAEVLAPHAIQRHTIETSRPARGRTASSPSRPADDSVTRVIAAYRRAVDGATAPTALERLIHFATRVGDLEAVDLAYQEWIRREPEQPDLRARYGDFLRNEKKDADSAIETYRQVLIWRPEDDVTRTKIAQIYVELGSAHLSRQEYATAESRFREAQKYITDGDSDVAATLARQQARLAGIRQQR